VVFTYYCLHFYLYIYIYIFLKCCIILYFSYIHIHYTLYCMLCAVYVAPTHCDYTLYIIIIIMLLHTPYTDHTQTKHETRQTKKNYSYRVCLQARSPRTTPHTPNTSMVARDNPPVARCAVTDTCDIEQHYEPFHAVITTRHDT